MKKNMLFVFAFLVFIGLLIVSSFLLPSSQLTSLNDKPKILKSASLSTLLKEKETQQDESEKHEEPALVEEKPLVDPIEFLIDRLQQPVKGIVVRPKTTEELRALFTTTNTTTVPRIFIDKLPDDFAKKGDPDLYAKVITALILRENERIIQERATLLLLKQKDEDGFEWTEKEENFFNYLTDKYDSKARKTKRTKLEDLVLKIDVIFPILAVIQSAEATDWGKEHSDSPFEQTGWLDNKTYARVPFDSLIQATESYAREMNGMPPLTDWRYMRFQLKGQGYADVGVQLLKWINSYKLEDPKYTDKLEERYKNFWHDIPDDISFSKWESPVFETGVMKVNEKEYRVEYAISPDQKKHGLMFRMELPTGTGMVFFNTKPQKTAVWMKNTFIPLDILFFDSEYHVVQIEENAQPLDLTHIQAQVPVQGFVELPAGTVQADHLQVGDKLNF